MPEGTPTIRQHAEPETSVSGKISDVVAKLMNGESQHLLTAHELHLLTQKPVIKYGRRRSDYPGRRAGDGQAAKEELRAALQGELNFIVSGGYRGKKRTPAEPTPLFKGSPICINNGVQNPTSCEGCTLLHFVPPDHRSDKVPCYAIPLDAAGHTVHDLVAGPEAEIEHQVAAWLRRMLKEFDK
jgi:hypothetical protein